MSRGSDYYRRPANFLNEVRQTESDLGELNQFFANGLDVNLSMCGVCISLFSFLLTCFAIVGTRTKTNRAGLVNFLIARGGDVNAPDNTHTPLHQACRNPNIELEVIRMLVENGAAINAPDLDDRTPLFWAIVFHSVEVVEFLCQMGADWDAQDKGQYTPLHWACMKNKVNHIKYLLLQKALFKTCATTQTPLEMLPPDTQGVAFGFISDIIGRSAFWQERNQRVSNGRRISDQRIAMCEAMEVERSNVFATRIEERDFRAQIGCLRRSANFGDLKKVSVTEDLRFTRDALFNVAVQEDVIALARRQIEMRRRKYEEVYLSVLADMSQVRNDFYDGLVGTHLLPAFDDCEVFTQDKGHFGDCRLVRLTRPYRNRSHFSVVIKKMDMHLFSLKDFSRYAQVCMGLNHPNIVHFYGWKMTREGLFLVIQHYTRTLQDYLEEGNSTILQDLRLVKSIARGMHYLHQREMLHGNLKLHNILLNEKDQAVLCDFWYRTEVKDENFNSSVKVFTAPEQILTSLFDEILKVDMYAFGILCYCIIFKKTEEDLFHRLHRKPVELVMFLHSNVIRPLLAKFPIELGIELRTEWRLNLQSELKFIKDMHVSSKGKKRREIIRRINEVVPKLLVLNTPKQNRAKASAVIDEYKKCIRGGGVFGRKKASAVDQMRQFRRGWDFQFREYYDATLLPKFKAMYQDKLDSLESISMHDLPMFLDLLRELLPNCSQKTLEYFEVMWKDMCYVKEYLKKTPEDFVSLMKKCWDHDATRRPESFGVVCSMLDDCIRQQLANARTMSPEEIEAAKAENVQEAESIDAAYVGLQQQEIANYNELDENEYEIESVDDESECRTACLKKVNDELEKLMRLKSAVEGEIREIDQRHGRAQQILGRLASERQNFTQERLRLNDREKAIKQKLRDVLEQEKMAAMEI